MMAVIIAAVALGYRALTGDESTTHIIGVGAILIAGMAFLLVDWQRRGWIPAIASTAKPEQRLNLIGGVFFLLSFALLPGMAMLEVDVGLGLFVWTSLLVAGVVLLWFYPTKRLFIRLNQWIRRRT
jgi:hypothetical protein